jgi:hypothetical protein
LDLIKGLNGVEYFLLFSFFDQTQTTRISIAAKPSVTIAISHIPSSSPFPSSSSHLQKEPSRRTTTVVTTTHCSAISQLNRVVVAIGVIDTA